MRNESSKTLGVNDVELENQEELRRLAEASDAVGFRKFSQYAALMGPAWLAIALNIGGATVAASVVLGSKTGFKFLWAIIPEVFAIWIVCVLFVRVTLATGDGPVAVARKHLGEAAAWVTGLSVFIVNTVFHAVQYMLIGITMKTIFGVDQRIGALAGLFFVLLIVFNPGKGRAYIKIIETVLRILVWALLLSFSTILFLVEIDWGDFFKGLIPSAPANPDEAISFVGVLGAAIAINVPVLAAYGAKQRNWVPQHRGVSLFELTYTNIMLLLVQFVIIMAVGSTLFKAGQVVTAPVAAAKALEPFAGNASVYLFSIGLLGAVFTTMVSQVLISGFIITDTLKWNVDAKSRQFKMAELVVTVFGVTAPLFGWNAFKGVVYGSAFNLTFAPVIMILWFVMGNRQKTMGDLRADARMNIALILAFLIALLATLNFWVSLVSI
jgi:Mn2+/Fe2+ NRAMP family transporter